MHSFFAITTAISIFALPSLATITVIVLWLTFACAKRRPRDSSIRETERPDDVIKRLQSQVDDLEEKNDEQQHKLSLLEEELQTLKSRIAAGDDEIFAEVSTAFVARMRAGEIGTKTSSATCSICYERNVDRVFSKCGHTLCATCLERLPEQQKFGSERYQCHVCRKKTQAVPLFLS